MQTQTFTQHEKDFVVEFLADILHGLTINNVLSRQDADGFVRMQDALEVMDNLKMLYVKHDEDTAQDWVAGESKATWTFTIDDANTALTNYDTEYREGICEQFEEACTDASTDKANADLDCDWATLAQRVTGYEY
jgi:Tfp pilus assembly pilus retraction ATPase PilT